MNNRHLTRYLLKEAVVYIILFGLTFIFGFIVGCNQGRINEKQILEDNQGSVPGSYYYSTTVRCGDSDSEQGYSYSISGDVVDCHQVGGSAVHMGWAHIPLLYGEVGPVPVR